MADSQIKIGKELCDALGIDPNSVVSISFNRTPVDIGTISIAMFVNMVRAGNISRVLKQFKFVVQAEEEEPPDA